MNSLLSSFNILHWLFFGMGAAVLGLLALIGGSLLPRTAARWASMTVLLVLGALAGAAYVLDEPHGAVVLGACFFLWSLGAALRTETFRSTWHFGLRWLGHSRLQAAVLLALAPAAFGMALHVEQAEIYAADQLLGEEDAIPNLVPVEGLAYTDRGTALAVFSPADPAGPQVAEREQTFLQRPGIRERVIRTGPANIETNCHGWVFTAGQYWVRGQYVEQILTENGYEVVSQPRENDIAIYRDNEGTVLHTALVRMVASDGLILLESKWGQYGRFLHGPEDQPYAPAPTYYHSARRGHVLRGLDRSYKPGTVTAQAS